MITSAADAAAGLPSLTSLSPAYVELEGDAVSQLANCSSSLTSLQLLQCELDKYDACELLQGLSNFRHLQLSLLGPVLICQYEFSQPPVSVVAHLKFNQRTLCDQSGGVSYTVRCYIAQLLHCSITKKLDEEEGLHMILGVSPLQ
jgi:hypothetical protein